MINSIWKVFLSIFFHVLYRASHKNGGPLRLPVAADTKRPLYFKVVHLYVWILISLMQFQPVVLLSVDRPASCQ